MQSVALVGKSSKVMENTHHVGDYGNLTQSQPLIESENYPLEVTFQDAAETDNDLSENKQIYPQQEYYQHHPPISDSVSQSFDLTSSSDTSSAFSSSSSYNSIQNDPNELQYINMDFQDLNQQYHITPLFPQSMYHLQTQLQSLPTQETSMLPQQTLQVPIMNTNQSMQLPILSSSQIALSSLSSSLTQTSSDKNDQFMDLTPYYVFPQAQAAKLLGISEGTLGRRWRDASMSRKWPFRSLARLDREIHTLAYNIGNTGVEEKANMEIQLSSMLKTRQELAKPVYIRMSGLKPSLPSFD